MRVLFLQTNGSAEGSSDAYQVDQGSCREWIVDKRLFSGTAWHVLESREEGGASKGVERLVLADSAVSTGDAWRNPVPAR